MSKALAVILFLIHFAHAFAGAHGAFLVFPAIQKEIVTETASLSKTDAAKGPLSTTSEKECEHDYELTDSGADEEIDHKSYLQMAAETLPQKPAIQHSLSHCKLIELHPRELNTPPPEPLMII